jgi:predicted transglutaminase-like cysteine proteinase
MGKGFCMSAVISALAIAGWQAYSLDVPAAKKPAKPQPVAFSLYCLRNIDECPTKGPKKVAMTAQLRSTIAYVHYQVNAEIRPQSEADDVWEADVASGDCDDYVMTKRRRLIEAGIPPTAMGLRLKRLADGEGHVTLLVRTTEGTYELDNLRKSVIRRF